MELEFGNQSGAGKADGYLKFWLNGDLLHEQKNMLWVPSHVPSQSIRGPWFHWYNGGSAVNLTENVRIWLRDIEVWIK